MERHSSCWPSQHDIHGTREPYDVRTSEGRVPLLSLGSILRSAVLITVAVFLAGWWDEKPASHGSTLLGTHPGKVLAVAFSPDGHWLASAGFDSPVLIWDMARRQIDTVLENCPAITFCVAFSPDGMDLAAAGSDGCVRIWNTSSWSLAHVIQAQTQWIPSVAFSPDGKLLAIAWGDRAIQLWDTSPGTHKASCSRKTR